jgi:peptidoglycan-associated lipoprotein
MKLIRIAHTGLLAVAASALVAGCSSVKLDDKPVEVKTATPKPVDPNAGGADAGKASQSAVTTVEAGNNRAAQDTNIPRVVYFDFDSFVVKDEFRPTIDANAKVLSGDRKRKVAVEGHTDERGGSEYNLALGQKRAEAVAKSLTLLGADDKQVEAVSFGKERPAAQGNDEAAWAKNRRAEIVNR